MYHLYTIAGLAMAVILLVRLLAGPSCLHDWDVAVERELPAPLEILGKEEIRNWRSVNAIFASSQKKFYAILRCRKCGALREFSTTSGGDPR